MKFWNKRDKIEFFHHEPSIIESFPIIESKDLKLNWIKRAKEDFQNHVKKGYNNKPGHEHLTRCPGIFDLFKYGYIISLHKDIVIRPKQVPNILTPYQREVELATFHESSMHLIAKPPWAANFIIKITTGWHVIAPKGVKFLILPIAYPDTFEFTAAIGIFDPATSTQINFPMFWNGTDKETIIKAGTPLGHLIPLSEKRYQMVQRNMNQQDKDWMDKVSSMHGSTFWPYTTRKKMVDMYNKYWKR